MKEQEASGFLSSLGTSTSLSKIPLVGILLFQGINKLRQPGFMYSACRPFAKNKERIQKSKETGD